MMIRSATMLVAALALVAGSTASAQDARVELSGTVGWIFGDGVSGDTVVVPGVGSFNRVDPKDSVSWGLRLGYMINDNNELGFLFNQQATELELGGGTEVVTLADVSIRNYHGYWAYNFGDFDATARPYFLFGLGATQYGSVTARVGDMNQSAGGSTRFSGSAALGSAPGSVSAWRPAGPRPTSSPTPPAGGVTPTGAATWSGTRSTPTSSRSPEASPYGSKGALPRAPRSGGVGRGSPGLSCSKSVLGKS
jgi:hypothetical protein